VGVSDWDRLRCILSFSRVIRFVGKLFFVLYVESAAIRHVVAYCLVGG
jgi:hypothetical protein